MMATLTTTGMSSPRRLLLSWMRMRSEGEGEQWRSGSVCAECEGSEREKRGARVWCAAGCLSCCCVPQGEHWVV
jgi:hypothetical protein